MTASQQLTCWTRLSVAVATLEMIQELRVGSAETQNRIGLALASARQDLAKLADEMPQSLPQPPRPFRRGR